MPDLSRLVEIKGAREGSGYLIADGLVLTCWHIVRPANLGAGIPPIRIRVQGGSNTIGELEPATVLWPTGADPGPNMDFALLRFASSSARPSQLPVVWSPLKPFSRVEVIAAGYPDVAIDRLEGLRDTKSMPGWILTGDEAREIGAGRGTHTLRMLDEDAPAEPATQAWPAMSGAAVFAHEALVGVVSMAGQSGERHQLQVLPVARLFEKAEFQNVMASLGCALRIAQPVGVGDQAHADHSNSVGEEDVAAELGAERLVFRSNLMFDLEPRPLCTVLDAYTIELGEKRLVGFDFSGSQFHLEDPDYYTNLLSDIQQSERVDLRRRVKRFEKMYRDGLKVILRIGYLKHQQVEFCFNSCYWLNKAIRTSIIYNADRAGFDIGPLVGALADQKNELYAKSHPMDFFYYNKLMREETIKVDLWDPDDNTGGTSAYIPRTSYAGKWFSYPNLSDKYVNHYSPNEYYSFILPQIVLRHFVNKQPLYEDWGKLRIGPG